MNFKESYKKANDNISGDISILDNLGEKKNEKVIRPNFYRLAYIAAALVLVATVAIYPLMKDKNAVTEDTVTENAEAGAGAEAVTVQETAFEEADEIVMSKSSRMKYIVADEVTFKEISRSEFLNLVDIKEEDLKLGDMKLNLPDEVMLNYGDDGSIQSFFVNFSLVKGDKRIDGIIMNKGSQVAHEEDEGFSFFSKSLEHADIFIKAYNIDEKTVEEYVNGIK